MFSLLIVDDHKHQVDTLAATLPWEELGISTIHKAYEGQGALAIMETHPVDIIITDIRMPGMTGLDLLKRINESNRKIDAILLTGYAEFEYAKKAIELHALEYLIKPVRDQLLVDAVSRIISKRQNELQHSQAFEQARAIFQELEQKQAESRAHLREAYLHILSCFTFLAHKKGKVLEDIIGIGSVHKEHSVIHSTKQLKAWCSLILEALIEEAPTVDGENHQHLLHKIQTYIHQNLSRDVTLQSISEHVYLHAVYLSKIYKEIPGFNLSEYILHARMEEAKRLLEQTSYKIYEITEKVGYQSPQHFIRTFKKYYGVTPDSFRKQ